MHTRNKPLKDLAREAIDVQDAVNLRGVLWSWYTALCQDCVPRGSPEELNLNTLYLSKVTSMLHATADSLGGVTVGANNIRTVAKPMEFSEAYEWAHKAKVG